MPYLPCGGWRCRSRIAGRLGSVSSHSSLKVLCGGGKAVFDLFGAHALFWTLDAVLGEVTENDYARHDVVKPIQVAEFEFEPPVAHIVTCAEPELALAYREFPAACRT